MTQEPFIIDEVDQFVRALPVKGEPCECGDPIEFHVKLEHRDFINCKGKDWTCKCVQFVRAKKEQPSGE